MQYEIRAMSFAEILDTALRLVGNHFALLTGLMACASLPAAAGESLFGPLFAGITALALNPLALAATFYTIGRLYRGHEVKFGEAWDYVATHLMPLMGTWLVMSIFTFLGFLCLIIPGIYLSISFTLVLPVMVVEELYGMNAIHRSRSLMNDNMMRGLGVLILASLITLVVGEAVIFVLAAIPMLGPLGAALVRGVTAAYAAAATMVLYFEIRCRKEGFDIEHLAERAERADLTADTGVAGA